METEFADIEPTGYLYNICFGGFSYSDEFIRILNERRLKAGMEPVPDYYEERSDPMAITLFQELGSDKSSGAAAELELAWFPKVFMKYLTLSEYDGQEGVRIDRGSVYAKLLHDFIEERKTNPDITAEELENRYNTIKHTFERYEEMKKWRWEQKKNNRG